MSIIEPEAAPIELLATTASLAELLDYLHLRGGGLQTVPKGRVEIFWPALRRAREKWERSRFELADGETMAQLCVPAINAVLDKPPI